MPVFIILINTNNEYVTNASEYITYTIFTSNIIILKK